jgi:hypothetical protein
VYDDVTHVCTFPCVKTTTECPQRAFLEIFWKVSVQVHDVYDGQWFSLLN